MRQKMTVFALTALLALGMTGCASGNNAAYDDTWPNGNYGTYDNGGSSGTWRNGGDSLMDGVEDAIDDAGDMLTGDRYHSMLENGRVHDSDGYLLDGENRHD